MTVNYEKFFRRPAIIDANVIIDLDEIRALELLEQVFARVVISEQVVHFELGTINLAKISFEKGNIASTEGYRLFGQLGEQYLQLSQYDREIVSIAYEKGLVCVTNERPMRTVCQAYNITVVGTLGVLGCANQTGLISQKRLGDLVNLLEHSSSYLGEELLRMFRQQFGLVGEAG